MTVLIRTDCGCYHGIERGGEYPRECRSCDGLGNVWVSANDRLFAWPGGPLAGYEPGCFARVAARVGVALTPERSAT